MKLNVVKSSMIHAVGYNDKTRELEVVFKTGRTYVYKGVPAKVFDELMAAESKGQFMRAEILNRYQYREIRSNRG